MKYIFIAIAIFATFAIADSGEDTSGTYFMADSDESFGPTYSWIDASSGTEWGPGDDSEYAVSTPFDIKFYGTDYTTGTTITLGCNGAMSFDAAVNISYGATIPSTGDCENVIAIWWDDMRGSSGFTPPSHLYDYTTTIGGENAWVFSYVDWYRYSSYGPGTWQMIIFETDGTHDSTIVLQYEDTDYGNTSYDHGNSAYVGIENAAGDQGHMYSDSTDVNLTDGLAIRYCDTENLLKSFNLLTPADGTVIDVWEKSNAGNAGTALKGNVKAVDVDVDFTWEAPDYWGPGDVTYTWECDDDPGFTSPDYSATGLTTESYTETFSVGDDATWYWRVTAIEDEYSGEVVCNDDFMFEFDHNVDVKSASLGEIKANFK